ncbi:MAG: hypothetical protein GY874_06170 [Desulfobacteraceae bacterium]|nr:hypothetical protein [Desulfobacteraceae bacterium]
MSVFKIKSTQPTEIDVSADMIGTLMDLGFLAGTEGALRIAEDIFNGVCVALPNHEGPVIGLSMVAMMAGDFEKSIKIIKEQALPLNTDSGFSKTFLGLSLMLANNQNESKKILQDVIAKKTPGADDTYTPLAEFLIQPDEKSRKKNNQSPTASIKPAIKNTNFQNNKLTSGMGS